MHADNETTLPVHTLEPSFSPSGRRELHHRPCGRDIGRATASRRSHFPTMLEHRAWSRMANDRFIFGGGDVFTVIYPYH